MKPGALRVWLFTAILGLSSASLAGLAIAAPAEPHSLDLPWWLVGAGFFVAEGYVVHFQFRREAHSFSLSEVPFVVGLFALEPAGFMLALCSGVSIALLVRRHQAPIKLLFNLSQMALGGAIGVTVFHLVTNGGVIGPTEWLGTFGATMCSGVVGTVAVTTAISLSEGRPAYGKLATVLGMSLIVTAANTSLAILAVTIAITTPEALWLLAIPIGTVFVAYQAYIAEREKHETIQFLYESSRILHRTPELEAAIIALLDHARRMFRAEMAEIALIDGRDPNQVLRTTVGPGEERVILAPGMPDPIGSKALAQDRPLRLLAHEHPGDVTLPRAGFAIRDLMVSPVRSETRPIGTMLVANRDSDVTTFATDDLILLETLAGHAGVALENGQLERSIHALTELRDELHHQANHDSLTGLVNRRFFAAHVQEQLEKPRTDGLVPVVLFLDLDDFKIVNDSLGHAAGDLLLRRTADRIRICTGDAGVAARLGGDEFAVMLLDQADLHRAENLAADLLEAVLAPVSLEGRDVSIAVSVGIAASAGPGINADTILRNADIAMYTAKARGKGRAERFAPAMGDAMIERQGLSADLRLAAARGELVLHYQPVIEIRSGATIGFEALVRWHHPELGLLMPNRFIPMAEDTGSIASITEWTLREACRFASAAHARLGAADWFVSVNISGHSLSDSKLPGIVRAAMAASELPASDLVLEVTESVLVRDQGTASARLADLRALGVRVAIDDFGTGYSSLNYLHNLPVDILKIARDFVETIETDNRVFALASTIVALASALGLDVIAEGIERPEQAGRLAELGCILVQGFLYARPLPAGDVEGWLEEHPTALGQAA